VFLHDREAGNPVDLSLQSEYSFVKSGAELYLEDRFYLRFEPSGNTGFREGDAAARPVITSRAGGIRIFTGNGSPVGDVAVSDTQGRLLAATRVAADVYTYRCRVPGVYLVRVQGETRKITVQ
jgi:hypothetical protein